MLIRMIACRTFCRRLCTLEHKTTYQTAPFDRLLALPKCAVLDMLQIAAKPFIMLLFNLSDFCEMTCNFVKSFFLC